MKCVALLGCTVLLLSWVVLPLLSPLCCPQMLTSVLRALTTAVTCVWTPREASSVAVLLATNSVKVDWPVKVLDWFACWKLLISSNCHNYLLPCLFYQVGLISYCFLATVVLLYLWLLIRLVLSTCFKQMWSAVCRCRRVCQEHSQLQCRVCQHTGRVPVWLSPWLPTPPRWSILWRSVWSSFTVHCTFTDKDSSIAAILNDQCFIHLCICLELSTYMGL